MNKTAVFIGGIHGVGKTTLCKSLASIMDIPHFSAGLLIQSAKKDRSENQDKRVHHIRSDQELLKVAINERVDPNSFYLLDGHFCLLNSINEVTKISLKTFQEIDPVGIIVLCDSIANLTSKNANRDDIIYDSDLLSSFQQCELQYSCFVATELQIPFLIFNITDDISVVTDFATNLTGGKANESIA